MPLKVLLKHRFFSSQNFFGVEYPDAIPVVLVWWVNLNIIGNVPSSLGLLLSSDITMLVAICFAFARDLHVSNELI